MFKLRKIAVGHAHRPGRSEIASDRRVTAFHSDYSIFKRGMKSVSDHCQEGQLTTELIPIVHANLTRSACDDRRDSYIDRFDVERMGRTSAPTKVDAASRTRAPRLISAPFLSAKRNFPINPQNAAVNAHSGSE